MVAGFLIIIIVAGLGSAVVALILGQSFWVVALAYILGGMLGLGLAVVLIAIRGCPQGDPARARRCRLRRLKPASSETDVER